MYHDLSNASSLKYFEHKVVEKNEFEIWLILAFFNFRAKHAIFLTKTPFWLRKYENCKNLENSKSFFSMILCPSSFGVGALESSWFKLHVFAIYEHLRTCCEHPRIFKVVPISRISFFVLLSINAHRCAEMLAKCRQMQTFDSIDQSLSNALSLSIIWQKVAENGSFDIPWFLIDSWCD